MSVNIILGKAKTGKSKYIYDSIEESINSGKKSILFVPSQTRAISEENYMNFLGKDGIIGVDITTISSYIESYIKKYNMNFSEKYISKLDKKIILNQVVSENNDSFKIFSKVKDKEGFLDMLNIYMDIFRKSDINLEKIDKLEIDNKLLEYKLKEVSYIYEKYLEKIKDKYLDSIDEFEMFFDSIVNKRIDLKDTNIFFDGYNNFTESEYKFIENLIKLDCSITITLNTDITSKEDIYAQNSQCIFENSNKTYLRILSICNKLDCSVNTNMLYLNRSKGNENIIFLADNLFSDIKNKKDIKKDEKLGIQIQYVTNMYSEIEEIAKKINENIRKGYRYNDFVIYGTDLNSYESVIKRVFYDYNIPTYISQKYSIDNSKLVEYINNILELCIYGTTIQRILKILKQGLNDIDIEDIYELENYSIEFNMYKFSIKNEFTINNKSNNDKIYDLNKLNKIRKEVIKIFDDIINFGSKEKNVKEIIKVLFNHLNNANILKNYKEYIVSNELVSLENKMREGQVWDKISEIFNSISKVYNSTDISISEFSNIFKTLLKDVNIKIIPPSIDQVMVVDINVNKVEMKKQVFFIGVNENIFPKKVDEDIFFSDIELQNLSENDIVFKETTISKNNMQLYNIYEALNNVLEDIYIFVPVSDMTGKNYRPSSIITSIKQIIDIPITGNISQTEDKNVNIYNVYSKDKLFEKMCEFALNINEDSKIIKNNFENKIKDNVMLYEVFKEDEKYNKILNYVKDDGDLDEEVLDLIYSDKLTTSVSKLELFKKCPFSYYMKYCLKISPRKEYQISSLDLGSFMHNVLEEFSKYLFENSIYWQAILINAEILDEKYQYILLNIIESNLDNILGNQKTSVKYAILKQKLINTMKKVIVTIAKSFNQSSFIPEGYEIEFKEGSVYAPIELKLQDNKSMIIIGKIDRIDALNYDHKKYIRVVDYKSSSKDLTLDDIKEGLSLQLITYLSAFIENMEKKNVSVIPAAMLYFNLSDKLLTLSEYTDDVQKLQNEYIKSLQMKGIYLKDVQILNKMDSNFEQDTNRYISISKRTVNSKNSKAIEEEEFKALCNEAKDIIKDIGNEIIKGVVKIRPNKKANHCKYCEFSSVCRKNICV